MRLSEYASTQRTYGSRKVPRSVQQSIPIDRIYEDGTWRCGNVYSQMWSMPDINFTMSGEDNNAKILNLLGKVYMGVPSDCWLKICIVSQRMDEKSFRENVLLHRNLDGLDKWRVERNRRIRQCVQDAGNVVQHKQADRREWASSAGGQKAHQANDRAVMDAYGFVKGSPARTSESACVAELMKMYQTLTSK